MNVAAIELCQELYELSGWDNTNRIWYPYYDDPLRPGEQGPFWALGEQWGGSIVERENIPAYDLGYLMRKLPEGYYVVKDLDHQEGDWLAWESENGVYVDGYEVHADIPEDAACKLAIELFKQGVLEKQQ